MANFQDHVLKDGTVIPVMDLKGKPYVMVQWRILWLSQEVESYEIDSQIISHTEDKSVVRSTVTIFKDGKVLRKASCTKVEHKTSFQDHLEKAETGSIGRALGHLGYGTQFLADELSEGDRIVDAPANISKAKKAPYKEAAKPKNHAPGSAKGEGAGLSQAQIDLLLEVAFNTGWDEAQIRDLVLKKNKMDVEDLNQDQFDNLLTYMKTNQKK